MVDTPPDPTARLDRAVDLFFASQRPIGMIAAVTGDDGAGGRWHWTTPRGVVERGRPQAPDPHTVWQLGSLTKTFTAALLAEAVHDGVLALDATVQDFVPPRVELPQFQSDGLSRPIQFVDLGTHSSGLPGDPRPIPPNGYLARDMYEYLNGYALAVEPGTHWNYSNIGFGLLAQVLVYVADRAGFGEAVRLLLQRGQLDLPDTVIRVDPDQRQRRARGYTKPDLPARWNSETWPAFDGSGALYSTSHDVLHWLDYQLGLQASPIDALLPIMQHVYFDDETHKMGLAWQNCRIGVGDVRYWGKAGDTTGFTAYAGFCPTARVGATVLTNSVWTVPEDLATELLRIMIRTQIR